MAIKNVGGHAVTSVVKGHGGSTPTSAQPKFIRTENFADYQGPSGGGVSPSKKSFRPSKQPNKTPTVSVSR
jgi:hypothetical protein